MQNLPFFEMFKALIIGIVEGITEWLPVSSTGHMLIVDAFLPMNMSAEFKSLFFIVIQLAAVCAVIILFWNRMFPFGFEKSAESGLSGASNGLPKIVVHKDIFSLWFKTVAACIPGAVAVFAADDFIEEHLYGPAVISFALIFYGIVFIVIENINKKRDARINDVRDIDYKTALIIGLFQVLSIIPGTSRSGATIIGALLIGVSRTAAAEFTFFLAVPVMIGSSLLKLLKYEGSLGGAESAVLAVGCITAFIVSLAAVKFLMSYIKKHDFKLFGFYRIAFGAAVLLLLGFIR
ncbi:undecaprenyl-diphosphate phosphatase [Treponema sp. HNW]|uniref:undecaprenyl-diphosphate phosphatase n=1 Tax=Treponema sp. HNW TaxID=3116654 RepID=UPI003D0BED9C